MLEFLKQLIYVPLYNAFALILNIPYVDAGIAVIVFTILIRTLLYPLSKKALISQIRLQELQPHIREVQEKYKDNKEEQAKKMMALYRDKKINPFSSILILLLQIPIIISLYHIFSSGALTEINVRLLYDFIPTPPPNDHTLLGIVDLALKSAPLALLAGITQYFVAYFQQKHLPKPAPKVDGKSSFQDDFTRTMSFQMKYFFPLFAFVVSLNLPSVLALYWTVGNLFSVVQELLLKKERTKYQKA